MAKKFIASVMAALFLGTFSTLAASSGVNEKFTSAMTTQRSEQ